MIRQYKSHLSLSRSYTRSETSVVETRARKIAVEWAAFRGRKVILAWQRTQREPFVLVLTSKLCVVEFLAGVLSTFNKSRDSLMPPGYTVFLLAISNNTRKRTLRTNECRKETYPK